MDKRRQVMFTPCGHIVCCYSCARRQQRDKGTCPKCRAQTTGAHFINVGRADVTRAAAGDPTLTINGIRAFGAELSTPRKLGAHADDAPDTTNWTTEQWHAFYEAQRAKAGGGKGENRAARGEDHAARADQGAATKRSRLRAAFEAGRTRSFFSARAVRFGHVGSIF